MKKDQLDRGSHTSDNTKKENDINKMGHMQEEIKNIFQKMPSNHYNAEKSSGKWTHELQQSKYNFRNMQGKMLLKC